MALPTKDQLMGYLQTGSVNVITARIIAEHFGVSDEGEEVPIRNAIREAIDDGELIGSSNRGFYIIDDESDFERYISSLESRISHISNRIDNLRRNWSAR